MVKISIINMRISKWIMSVAFLLVSILIFNNSKAQMTDNWIWMNPKPQGNSINAIDFINDNTGYAAGAFGTIIKTIDNGNSWSKINSGLSTSFLSLDFYDENNGFIGSTNQLLLKTSNGGNNWTTVPLPVTGPFDHFYYIMDINFINQNTVFVLGFYQLECKIWKTTDSGNNWTTQSTGGANYLKSLYFIDENIGFGVGGALGGEIIKTTNGGANWILVLIPDYAVESICFKDASTGFAGCEEGRIYSTTNGGINWNPVWSETSLDITSINFINADTGLGFGTGSVYTKTTNGGVNWFEFSIGNSSIRQYFDASMTPNGTIHAAGSYGAMIRTSNAGANFISQPFVTEGYISNIKFVNNSTGYAVAGFSSGDILKTTNAGESWVSQISSYTTSIYGISFLNAETGYLAGSISIYKTSNGGTNWLKLYNSTTNEIFTDVFFSSMNTGYVVGSGKLYKTTNAGNNWISTLMPGNGFNSLYFTNDNIGYSVGGNNSAVKTTNGGVNWTAMSIPGTSFLSLNNIFFSSADTGFVSSATGIFKTTNAGVTWFALTTPQGGYNSVQFRGSFGYAVGGSGKIIKSTDGGNSWITQPTVTSNTLYTVYFNSDNYVYAGGLLGTMIKTIPTELVVTSSNPISTGIPTEFSLRQNYPNPFNPATSIVFDVKKSQHVVLNVYDINGKFIEQLVNGSLNAGSHKVKWDASNYSSGIYFYTLITNGYKETKRMMLIR